MNISEDARIWIYQASRFLSDEEVFKIQEELNKFTSQWQAHGHQLVALGEIRHRLFIIISVDEQYAAVTGCSIDKSVHFIKELEKKFNINLLDRMQMAYRNGATDIKTCHYHQLAELFTNGAISSQATVFNNLIVTRKELQTKWELPITHYYSHC